MKIIRDKNRRLVTCAGKEMHSYWNLIPYKLNSNSYSISDILVRILKLGLIAKSEIKNSHLYKISQVFPDSKIISLSGQPILYIKKD